MTGHSSVHAKKNCLHLKRMIDEPQQLGLCWMTSWSPRNQRNDDDVKVAFLQKHHQSSSAGGTEQR